MTTKKENVKTFSLKGKTKEQQREIIAEAYIGIT
ncbi:hypothetical protein EZS27_035572 [termite gut metagenome]|uniref:Uncharacterized protein n=1 Tax=termite gut metagenome TaxID=433724 RepID=A0A5J4PZG1_9ZZZZ